MANETKVVLEQIEAYRRKFGEDFTPFALAMYGIMSESFKFAYPVGFNHDNKTREHWLDFKKTFMLEAVLWNDDFEAAQFQAAENTKCFQAHSVAYGVIIFTFNQLMQHVEAKGAQDVHLTMKTQYEIRAIRFTSYLLKKLTHRRKMQRATIKPANEQLQTPSSIVRLLHPMSLSAIYLHLIETVDDPGLKQFDNQEEFKNDCFNALSLMFHLKLFCLVGKDAISKRERKQLFIRTKGWFREPSALHVFRTMQSELTIHSLQRLIYGTGPVAVDISVD